MTAQKSILSKPKMMLTMKSKSPINKKTLTSLHTIDEYGDFFKKIRSNEGVNTRPLEVPRQFGTLPSPLSPKKSIYSMSQLQLYDHITGLMKNIKSELAANNPMDEVRCKIMLLNECIDIMRIYREMRKIISMSFQQSIDLSPEQEDINVKITDQKCRLTLLKCLSKVAGVL